MPVVDYALLWIFAIAIATAADQAWMRWIRPWLERRYGWAPLSEDERIPAIAWAGGGGACFILLFVVPYVGVAAGY
ncbi:hypothetical protein H0A73_17260 [Alcaligenaceae bacterium]|nr:hypothetical protein [Alcaligenaceae bacterium]